MAGWGFWAVAVVLALAVAAILISALRQAGGVEPAADQDLRVYKDQLAEVERDVARGTLGAEEAQRLRTEVGRRVLEADRAKAQSDTFSATPPKAAKLAAAMMVLLLPATLLAYSGTATVLRALGVSDQRVATLRNDLSFELHFRGVVFPEMSLVFDGIGAPGYPDLPLERRLALSAERMANRPSQAEAVAAAPKPPAPSDLAPDFLDLMVKLRTAVAERPDDLRGLELLSRNEAALGNLAAAEAAQRRVIALKAASVTAADHAALAEIMIAAAGGFVSPEAEAELIAALKLDPKNPTARYYSGVLFADVGRFDRTFALWQPLLEEGPADAPWIAPIRAGIGEVAYRAGVNYELPPEKGPTAADVGAAAEMTPEERRTMIAGMVAQLSDRLATEGGSVEDWNRLIRSLTVLERRSEAQTIYDEAKTRFAGQDAELSFLRLAAVETGLAP